MEKKTPVCPYCNRLVTSPGHELIRTSSKQPEESRFGGYEVSVTYQCIGTPDEPKR